MQPKLSHAPFFTSAVQVLHERGLVERNELGMETETVFAYLYRTAGHGAEGFRGNKRERRIARVLKAYMSVPARGP